jgi:hypothetical protein
MARDRGTASADRGLDRDSQACGMIEEDVQDRQVPYPAPPLPLPQAVGPNGGFPTNVYTVMFALGRLPGWVAHWRRDGRLVLFGSACDWVTPEQIAATVAFLIGPSPARIRFAAIPMGRSGSFGL